MNQETLNQVEDAQVETETPAPQPIQHVDLTLDNQVETLVERYRNPKKNFYRKDMGRLITKLLEQRDQRSKVMDKLEDAVSQLQGELYRANNDVLLANKRAREAEAETKAETNRLDYQRANTLRLSEKLAEAEQAGQAYSIEAHTLRNQLRVARKQAADAAADASRRVAYAAAGGAMFVMVLLTIVRLMAG